MNIYVASSWRNEYQPRVVELLREKGHEVYDFKNPEPNTGFAWSDIDANWQNWSSYDFVNNLEHDLAEKGFSSDFAAMKAADLCVLVLPCGRSAHAEAGFMKGAGKKVIAYLPEKIEPELMYKMFDDIATSEFQLINVLSLTNMSHIMDKMLNCLDGRKGR